MKHFFSVSILCLLIFQSSEAQNLLQGGEDAIVKIRDTRSGVNWSYLQWEFNNSQRDWVLGRNPTGNFVLYRENFGYGLVVESDGNVGIGKANPYYRLDVDGRVNANGMVIGDANGTRIQGPSGMGFRASGSGNNHMTLLSNGNIGIGKADPYFKLDVDGRVNANGLLIGDANGTRIQGPNGIGLRASGSGNNHMTIVSNGNVGIGTTSPTSGSSVRSSEGDLISPLLHIYSNTNNAHPTLHISAENHDEASVLLTENSSNSAYGTRMYYDGAENNFFNIAIGDNGTWTNRFSIHRNGNVGIGTTNPQSKLAVAGQIRATEVQVLADISVPDYVFEPDYQLRSLKETKAYIEENKHLPEIPSAAEIDKNGIALADMNMRLLKKIEELTLYQIELLERLEQLEAKNTELEELKRKVQRLEGN